MSDNGILPELVEVDEGGSLEERFARLEQLVTTLVAQVGRMTRVPSGPSLAGDGKCGSGFLFVCVCVCVGAYVSVGVYVCVCVFLCVRAWV